MTFSAFDLLPQSLRALAEQGIRVPTPIQEKAIPLLLDYQDLIGQARTGSGKTLAFVLPMLEFVDPKKPWIQAVVLTPTRELANQIVEVIDRLGRCDRVRVLPVFGGRSIGPQIATLRRGAHILVATPGRLLDLLRRKAVTLEKVVYAVVDEADEMLDQGFAKDVEAILRSLKGEHLTALFSATMPDWVHQASRKYLHKPVTVTVDPLPEQGLKIEHLALRFPATHRLEALRSLLDRAPEGSSIVFGRTKHGVRKLAKRLTGLGYSVGCLQGNMSQNARDRVMQDFRDQQVSVLVATNVAARGLDVDHVELVVNYELPESPLLLTHRVGRTGRMGREGLAYTLVADTDDEQWSKLKRGLKLPIRTLDWGPQSRPARSRTNRQSRQGAAAPERSWGRRGGHRR